MIYIICFFVSTFFLWLGTRQCTNRTMKNEQWAAVKFKKVPVVIGLLLPILLATFRAASVGTDVEVYVVRYFELSVRSNSFFDYMTQLGGVQDIGYIYLNFILTRITNDIGLLFFFVEAIVICFAFAACWELRCRAYPWLSMLFFYFTFYNITLSTVRQCCACAISFYAISIALVEKLNKKKFVQIGAYLVLAISFHATAMIVFFILIICVLIKKGKINPMKFGILTLVVCICLRILANQFLRVLNLIIPVFSSKYSKAFFLNNQAAGTSGFTMVIVLAILILFIQFGLYRKENRDYWKGINRALLGLNFIYVAAMLFLSNLAFIPRLLYYIEILWVLPLTQTSRQFSNNKLSQTISTIGVIDAVFLYWLLFFIIRGVHGTYPYMLR